MGMICAKRLRLMACDPPMTRAMNAPRMKNWRTRLSPCSPPYAKMTTPSQMTRLTTMDCFAPIHLASLPQKSAPKKAMNWIMRMTAVRVWVSSSMPPRIMGAAAKVAETAMTVWMPSL